MTHAQLVLVLTVYVVIAGARFACDKLFPLPEPVGALVPRFAARGERPSRGALLYIVYGLAALGCSLVGLVGLFVSWHPSPLLFTVGILALAIPGQPWSALTAVDKFLLELELFLGGVISTLTLFGPAKHLFE